MPKLENFLEGTKMSQQSYFCRMSDILGNDATVTDFNIFQTYLDSNNISLSEITDDNYTEHINKAFGGN